MHYLTDPGEVVEDAGGGFRVDEGDGVESAFCKLGTNCFGVDCLTPLNLDGLCLLAAFYGDIDPFVRESAAA